VRYEIFLFSSSKICGWYHSPRCFQLVIHNRDFISYFESLHRVISIAARLRVVISWLRFLAGTRFFSLLQNIHAFSGTYRASCSMGTTVLLPKIKRPEREADRLPPPTAKVTNVWEYTSAPAYFLMAFIGITITLLFILHVETPAADSTERD
jgi:hypothetical protein